MASITKRGSYQFQAQVRRKGHSVQTRTFETKWEAEAWATVVEFEMHRGVLIAGRVAKWRPVQQAIGQVTPGQPDSPVKNP